MDTTWHKTACRSATIGYGRAIATGPYPFAHRFTGGYESEKWSPLLKDFYSDCHHCWFNERIEPPSWILGDGVVANGAKGILFKLRLKPAGMKLVLYTERLNPTDRFDVYHPLNTVP